MLIGKPKCFSFNAKPKQKLHRGQIIKIQDVVILLPHCPCYYRLVNLCQQSRGARNLLATCGSNVFQWPQAIREADSGHGIAPRYLAHHEPLKENLKATRRTGVK